MARATSSRGGSGPWLAFLLGVVVFIAAVAAWLLYAAPRPSPDVAPRITAPAIPQAPKLPAPTLPSRTIP